MGLAVPLTFRRPNSCGGGGVDRWKRYGKPNEAYVDGLLLEFPPAHDLVEAAAAEPLGRSLLKPMADTPCQSLIASARPNVWRAEKARNRM